MYGKCRETKFEDAEDAPATAGADAEVAPQNEVNEEDGVELFSSEKETHFRASNFWTTGCPPA